jgi:hypothetical protein
MFVHPQDELVNNEYRVGDELVTELRLPRPLPAWDDRNRSHAVLFDGHTESLAPGTFALAISDPAKR